MVRAEVVGTFGPQPVLPGSSAKQVKIINYPGADLDLLGVFKTNAEEISKALKA